MGKPALLSIFHNLQGDECNGTICPLIGQIDSAFDQSDSDNLQFVIVTLVLHTQVGNLCVHLSCNFTVAHKGREFVCLSLRLCETSLLKKSCTNFNYTYTKYFNSYKTVLHIHKTFHKLKLLMTFI